MHHASDNSDTRPTLPGIWDLFGDELSGSADNYHSRRTTPDRQDIRHGYHHHDRTSTTPDRSSRHSVSSGGIPGVARHHDPGSRGSDTIRPRHTATPTPSLPSDGPSCQTQTVKNRSTPPAHEDRYPGANYSTFRCFPPSAEAGNSKYECEHCGKAFTRPSTLQTHLNSHTGDKPFVCPVEACGRSFSVLSNMRRHARGHSQPPSEGTAEEGKSSDTI